MIIRYYNRKLARAFFDVIMHPAHASDRLVISI